MEATDFTKRYAGHLLKMLDALPKDMPLEDVKRILAAELEKAAQKDAESIAASAEREIDAMFEKANAEVGELSQQSERDELEQARALLSAV